MSFTNIGIHFEGPCEVEVKPHCEVAGLFVLKMTDDVTIFGTGEWLAGLNERITAVLAAQAMTAHDAGCAITNAAPPPMADERLDGVIDPETCGDPRLFQ